MLHFNKGLAIKNILYVLSKWFSTFFFLYCETNRSFYRFMIPFAYLVNVNNIFQKVITLLYSFKFWLWQHFFINLVFFYPSHYCQLQCYILVTNHHSAPDFLNFNEKSILLFQNQSNDIKCYSFAKFIQWFYFYIR